jgi:hypothetical protein
VHHFRGVGADEVNITLSIDERVADQARKAAQAMGKSLNQAVRDHLEQLAGGQQVEAEIATFQASARQTPGRLGGWRLDRDEANRRA